MISAGMRAAAAAAATMRARRSVELGSISQLLDGVGFVQAGNSMGMLSMS